MLLQKLAQRPPETDPESDALRAEADARDEAARQDNFGRALEPLGLGHSGAEGLAGLAETQSKLAYAFGQIAPKLRSRPEATLADVLPTLEREASRLPEVAAERLREVALEAAQLPIAGAEACFGRLAAEVETHPGQAVLARAAEVVLAATRDSIARQNPAYAQRLRTINESWKWYVGARRRIPGPTPTSTLFAAARRGQPRI